MYFDCVGLKFGHSISHVCLRIRRALKSVLPRHQGALSIGAAARRAAERRATPQTPTECAETTVHARTHRRERRALELPYAIPRAVDAHHRSIDERSIDHAHARHGVAR